MKCARCQRSRKAGPGSSAHAALLGARPRGRGATERQGLDARLAVWLAGHLPLDDERTVIASTIPRVGVGNKIPLLLVSREFEPSVVIGLIGNLASMPLIT